ncbi:MAG: aldehyde dehydrogenase family protein [Flavobacteriales bacterium]|nr:aldehyde dehydrogenase family protein [Flavobacteriales bacterium]MCW8912314.1 aldehyde dehydrogenase family protein [Flavobacteriales bacterium]MCW8938045.1 aldehyde dehydrogenase family protein [Flavobacteriales bacterium]MCW8968378.1 aldehyde dehydrogenase family protein [Flavobacteriales bacterium]MCW8991078.1 aldehyde dehydrogenase family protein [Flavobacteriales bacterium]
MLKVVSPYNLELIKEIPVIGKDEVEKQLQTAYALFENQSNWLPAHQRIAILEKTAEIMKGRVEELTKIAAQEGGKPYIDSKVEVLRAINGVKLAAEHIAQIKGEEIPMGLTQASVNRVAFVSREPIGVVASVSAFNHPLNLTIHQTVTAFAAGCPVIIKPASTTPLSCLNFIEILKEAGMPKGWCQAVVCDREAATYLVTDKRVNYFSFIGSSTVGWNLKSKLAPGTRCALEHGGVAPVIVEKDADIEELIPALTKGGFYHAGQVCVSVQKVFVHESICENVAQLLATEAKKLIVGDPLDEKTEVGPLITPQENDRVEAWVNEAIEKGAKVLCGGKKISNTCFEPTVLLNPPADTKVSTDEIFGPVVCVYSYTNRLDAIKIANSLDVHFQAAVFTKNIDVALDSVKKLNATAVMVNDHTAFRVDWMPFGGRDASGIGMGGIPYSIHEMTREKLMVLKSKLL